MSKKSMNKTEMVEKVAKSTGASIAQTERIIDSALSSIILSVDRGTPVTIYGFGKFSSHVLRSRNGVNPVTGELQKRPAVKKLVFSCSDNHKERTW